MIFCPAIRERGQDAKRVRKEAEEKYFRPILEKYNRRKVEDDEKEDIS